MVLPRVSLLALVFTQLSTPLWAEPQPTQPQLSQPGPTLPTQPAPTVTDTQSAQWKGFVKGPWQLPTRGFSLSLPEDWKAQKFGLAPQVLSCALQDKAGQIRQIISIAMGVSNASTLRGHADMMTKGNRGQLVGGPLLLDKKPALRLKLSGDEPGMDRVWGQQTVLLAAQGAQTFTIRVFAQSGENIEATVAALLQGWHWQPFAPAILHLQLSPTPSSFAKGRLKINLPDTMWIAPSDFPGSMLAIYDAGSRLSTLTLSVEIVPVAKGVPLTVLRRSFALVLQQRFHLGQGLNWSDFAGAPPRSLSSLVELPAALAVKTGVSSTAAYGLVKMQGNDWGVLTFTVTGQSGASQALYGAAVQKMFASVRLGGASTDATKILALVAKPQGRKLPS